MSFWKWAARCCPTCPWGGGIRVNEVVGIVMVIAVIWVVVIVGRALWYAFTAGSGPSGASSASTSATTSATPPRQTPVPQAPLPGAQKTTTGVGATSSDRLGDEAAELMRAGYIVNVFELEPGMGDIEFDEYGQIKSGTQPDMCLLVTVPLAMVDGTTLMAFAYFLIWDRSQFPDRAPEVRSEITQERSDKTGRWEVHVESPSLAARKRTTRF